MTYISFHNKNTELCLLQTKFKERERQTEKDRHREDIWTQRKTDGQTDKQPDLWHTKCKVVKVVVDCDLLHGDVQVVSALTEIQGHFYRPTLQAGHVQTTADCWTGGRQVTADGFPWHISECWGTGTICIWYTTTIKHSILAWTQKMVIYLSTRGLLSYA